MSFLAQLSTFVLKRSWWRQMPVSKAAGTYIFTAGRRCTYEYLSKVIKILEINFHWFSDDLCRAWQHHYLQRERRLFLLKGRQQLGRVCRLAVVMLTLQAWPLWKVLSRLQGSPNRHDTLIYTDLDNISGIVYFLRRVQTAHQEEGLAHGVKILN